MVEDVEDLEGSPESMDLVLNTAVLHVHARCAVDPRAAKSETWEAVVTAMQIHSALYAVTSTNEGTVRCRIVHKVRTLPAIGPRTYASAGNRLTPPSDLPSFAAKTTALTHLCEVPLDQWGSRRHAHKAHSRETRHKERRHNLVTQRLSPAMCHMRARPFSARHTRSLKQRSVTLATRRK